MPGHFNIDKAVIHIKSIADNNRCVTCDKLLGVRMRFSCGHTICQKCIEIADECLTCINSESSEAVTDIPQIQRVQNASNLLFAFQDTFKIDVYKRYRYSEKIRLEKEVFPECIEATYKYYNKRKSSQFSNKEDKENQRPSYFAGDDSFGPLTMNTRINLVQKWLENNENITSPVRKPFSDINVNSTFTVKKNGSHIASKDVASKTLCNKKLKIKSNVKKVNLKSKNYTKEIQNLSLQKLVNSYSTKSCNKEQGNKATVNYNVLSESYNTVQHGGVNVIDDSSCEVVDKDKLAWLAVLQANEKDPINKLDDNADICDSVTNQGNEGSKQNNIRKNVLFIKKDYLFKSCFLCLCNYNDYLKSERLHDVSITINTKEISTSISFSSTDQDSITVFNKHSIATQTDKIFNDGTIMEVRNENNSCEKIALPDKAINLTSQDFFANSGKNYELNGKTKVEIHNITNQGDSTTNKSDVLCLVINDSDSDQDIYCSDKLEVTADVHSPSNIPHGVLSAVQQIDYESRVRREVRRRTIDSNNSSEKENIEPNRIKKPRLGKKLEIKK